jgi:spore maturation protein CgeB
MWQLLKALAERGVELVVSPYQGPSIESPWWTASANPCEHEGDAVAWVKRLAPRRASKRKRDASVTDTLVDVLVQRVTKPRWRSHLLRTIEAHRDFDGVLFLTVPPNHFTGIPTLLLDRFGLPTYFYDGDVPASLPRFAGFHTGFRIYQGADLGEFTCVFSSSKGGVADLLALGARDVHVLYYAADPSVFPLVQVEQDIDVFFYGLGREYREQWVDAMLDGPSREMPETHFAVRGKNLGRLDRVDQLPYASFSRLSQYCRRSRINLLITRHAHASVYASSNARPFELAALESAMVSNPYLGMEEWFEPGREVLIVRNQREAVETYRSLLRDGATRKRLGQLARKRLLEEHTYGHRADQLLKVLRSPRSNRGSADAARAVTTERPCASST